MNFFSRAGQDRFLFENFFRGRRNGIFVDVGAGDGETGSNTLFFERFMDWRGLCIEPRPEAFAKLTSRRKASCEQLPANRLGSLLEKHVLPQVDFCSIDTPGSELEVLSTLDFTRFNIGLLSIATQDSDGSIRRLLAKHGYELAAQLGTSLIFRRNDIRRQPRTSVICAVWHGDANRHRLLEGHAATLARQTVPVEPVYIFDGRDEPPACLPGRKIVAHENLSIYQAWNLGLAMASTPFVMNLNLDDRLAPNAVEVLENVLIRENAALVGGEWRICYSQPDTDATVPCFPGTDLPFVAAWPPPAGTPTRLGSGTGERGTLGPATLWRMDSHIGVPRYPWRFPDGTLIKVIADTCWWTLLMQHLKKKVVRLTDVIGNYHSHPGEQAEFRGPPNETALMNSLGLSLY
ncbi:MAG TPA: FkbM family methyltransferase [Steroidobacteraceae bacterium]|nr:FkbM family methyltransferase [Steroidobacteraceae bacterium]